jgi:hypothetical protein
MSPKTSQIWRTNIITINGGDDDDDNNTDGNDNNNNRNRIILHTAKKTSLA